MFVNKISALDAAEFVVTTHCWDFRRVENAKWIIDYIEL